MSSSNSNSYPYKHDQKLKSINVYGVEGKESMNKMKHTSPQRVVSQGTVIQRPSFSLSAVPTLRETMETNPPKSDCYYCKEEFPSPNKEEREVEMLWNKIESSLSEGLSLKRPYNSFHDEVQSLFSQVDLSNHRHLESSHGPLNSIRGSFNDNHSNTHATPYQFFTQNPSYRSSLSTQGPFDGPFKYGGGGSSSNKTYPLVDGAPTSEAKRRRTTMFPPLSPTHLLTENTHYSSHASSNGDYMNPLHGPSKFTGDCNYIRNVYSSFNGGGTTNMNIVKRPRYHSLAGNIPSSSPAPPHPPPQITRQWYDSFAGNIHFPSPACLRLPPPQTTNQWYDSFAGNIHFPSPARLRPPSNHQSEL